jgi:hypothetical protein
VSSGRWMLHIQGRFSSYESTFWTLPQQIHDHKGYQRIFLRQRMISPSTDCAHHQSIDGRKCQNIVRNCQNCRRVRLAKLSNRRVNEHGICVAVVFYCSETRNSDAKNNKRTFFPEATAYAKALALVASRAWHLLFSCQSSLVLQQITG